MTERHEFSEKYNREHAERYLRKHRTGFSRKLSHWREVQIARKALQLANQPNLILDLPCGAGRFWPMLAEKSNRSVIGADNSLDMLAVACNAQPAEVVKRVSPLHTSAFEITLPDKSVDSIFSMRLIHHIGLPADRLAMLKEFCRVTRDSVIISLWVDGNFKAWKRKRAEANRIQHAYQNRFVIPTEVIEDEFRQAGFTVENHIDFIPLLHMWRVYVLRAVK
ncbi:class I SAM-dependent methyltransferase [Pseudomonas sp. R151218B TE3479]